MSLVNDMLRDLDARQRTPEEGFKAVPANKARRRNVWIWIVLVLALLAVGLWLRTSGLLHNIEALFAPPPAVQPANEQADASPAVAVTKPAAATTVAVPTPTPEPPKVDIAKISWMSGNPNEGTLTFWLAAPTGFSVHNRTDQQLDIELADTRLAGELPERIAPLLNGLDIVNSPSGSRFVLSSEPLVRFDPQLKQGPDRLVVRVSRLQPVAVPAVETESTPANAPEAPQAVTDVTPKPVNAEPTAPPATPSAAQAAMPKESEGPKGEWRKAHNTAPTDATMVRNARRLLAQGRTNDAIAELQQFVQQQPAAVQSRFLLTQLYLAIENYPAAQAQFAQAPQNLSWGLLEARALLQQGKGQAAEAVLARFAQQPRSTDYLELRAAAAQQQQQYAQAAARYIELLELNAAVARWWINLGMVLEQQGQTAKALNAYQTAQKAPDVTEQQRAWLAVQLRRLTQ